MNFKSLLKGVQKNANKLVNEDSLKHFLKKNGSNFGKLDDAGNLVFKSGKNTKMLSKAYDNAHIPDNLFMDSSTSKVVKSAAKDAGDIKVANQEHINNFIENEKKRAAIAQSRKESRQARVQADYRNEKLERSERIKKNYEQQKIKEAQQGVKEQQFANAEAYAQKVKERGAGVDTRERKAFINQQRKRSQELRDKYSNQTVEVSGDRLESQMRTAEKRLKIEDKRRELKNNSLDTSNRGDRTAERKVISVSPSAQKQQRIKAEAERASQATRNAAKESAAKKQAVANMNAQNWVYRAAGLGVGGGLVLSMSNNKGQQTNNQLYGQGY